MTEPARPPFTGPFIRQGLQSGTGGRLHVDVDIFAYEDFRVYLEDWLVAARRENPSASHRWFAQKVGTRDPSVLTAILTRRRRLTPERTRRFAEALGLDPEETEYFGALVDWAQARTREATEAAYARMVGARTRRHAGDVTRDAAFALFRAWYIPAILEMVGLRGFREDPEWIALHTEPPITASQAAEALELGLELGYLERRGGRLVPTASTRRTPLKVTRMANWAYHRDALELASASLQRMRGNKPYQQETGFMAGAYAIPRSMLPQVRELLYDVSHAISGLAAQSPEPAEDVFHLEMALFPVARTGDDPEEP
jgi:uncharacterized protein (TIGR02147 family)